MDAEIGPGRVAVSMKGHDTGRAYVVFEVVSAEFVLVIDGKYRKRGNPKRKRVKHLRFVGGLEGFESKSDAALYKALRTYTKTDGHDARQQSAKNG